MTLNLYRDDRGGRPSFVIGDDNSPERFMFSFPTEAEGSAFCLGFSAAEQLTEACERITWSQWSKFFPELDASGLLDVEDRTDVQPVPQLSAPERLRLTLSQLLNLAADVLRVCGRRIEGGVTLQELLRRPGSAGRRQQSAKWKEQ